MKLPNAGSARVPEAKVTNYLLSLTHRVGKSKAAFFTAAGFSVNRWLELANALKQHAQNNDVVESEDTEFGVRYVIDGTLSAPNAIRLNVRSVWFIDKVGDSPRFVTAHPLERRK